MACFWAVFLLTKQPDFSFYQKNRAVGIQIYAILAAISLSQKSLFKRALHIK
jgi:hypothetical protein